MFSVATTPRTSTLSRLPDVRTRGFAVAGWRASPTTRLTPRKRHRLIGSMVIVCVSSREGGRVAFTCSRRLGGAVVRNRARRIMREAVRALAPHIRGDHHLTLVAQPAIRGARMHEVLVEVRSMLGRAGQLSQ